MKIAIIGYHKSFGCGSYPHRIAEVLEKDHTVYRIPTQTIPGQNIQGRRPLYKISELMINLPIGINLIIVVQSHILITNDTKIPLILLKTERMDDPRTVENPTHMLKKLEVIHDLGIYGDNIFFPVIDLKRYNPNREKDVLIGDMQYTPQTFEPYIEIMERCQHAIIFQRFHEVDCITTRVLEAMACKTIPIIFYNTNFLRQLYEMMGINDTNAYFVCVARSYNLEIKEYDIEMANRGYDLVQKYFGTEVLAAKIMSMIKEPCVVKVEL